jgi:hypothetical protein
LNAAYEPLKDNRLLPLGFKRSHFTYDTVAIWGSALNDPQYDAESANGMDKIEYRIPLNGKKGLANLEISFKYQTLPLRWMKDIFSNDSLEYVAQFKSMYQGYEDFVEVIDEMEIKGVNLSTTANDEIELTAMRLFPNPGNGNDIFVEIHSNGEALRYEMINSNGIVLQARNVLFSHLRKRKNNRPGSVFSLIVL